MSSMTHSLKLNGAPYTNTAAPVHADPKVTSGTGRALCTCGQLSEELPTGAARRAWHKAHKAEEAAREAAREAAQPEETETVQGQDVLAGTPEDEVAEALAELVEAPKAKRTQAERTNRATARAARATAKAGVEVPAGAVMVEVPFANTVALHFWHQLGRPSAKVLAEKYPALQVAHDDKTRTVKVIGEEGQARLAAAELAACWVVAPEVFRTWKQETPAYRALKHTLPEDRRVSHAMTVAFWADFARQQLLGTSA